MQKNQEFILDIEAVSTDGSGIGRVDGMAVFVPLTAVGDKAKVKILKVKKNYAFGKLISLIKSSKSRIDNDCAAFRQCGGCVYRHIGYEAESAIKQSAVYENIKRIGGIDMPPKTIITDKPNRYRNKVQSPITADYKSGFYAVHSHRIIPCEECLLQPEIFGRITDFVTDWAKINDISIYDETEHKGFLRHIYIRRGEKTGEIMVCLVANGEILPESDSLVDGLLSVCGDSLKSVVLNINKKDTNVILGEKCKNIYGDGYITDILCGTKVRLSALSFYQVNSVMAEKLYNKAREYANPKDKNIIDLYCGAGTIGLSMAKEAKSIIGVEIIPEAIKDAEYNAKLNGIENARFICADATEAAKQLAKEGITADTVIVDPPRKGCSVEVINTIADSFKPQSVVYVSCDSATLARDIKIFAERGYELVEYTPCDLFPRTAHVETVAILSRNMQMGEKQMLCDMHIHSNCSDGTFSPEELIEEAKANNIKAIALCDHNTILGLERILAAAKNNNVEVVPGVEVTTAFEGDEVHILGLFLKQKHYPQITKYLAQINEHKIANNKTLAETLNKNGFDVDYDAILANSGEAVPNRVHFARELMAKGYVSSISEAFDIILAENGDYYKPAEKLDALEVIAFLNSVEAIPVLAHPLLNLSYEKLCKFLPEAKKRGLIAMETIYPLFSKTDSDLAKKLAKDYGLFQSGGSDFHGSNKPEIKIGRGKDNIFVPYETYENLKKVALCRPKQITDETICYKQIVSEI